jgi:hypothetical protein
LRHRLQRRHQGSLECQRRLPPGHLAGGQHALVAPGRALGSPAMPC